MRNIHIFPMLLLAGVVLAGCGSAPKNLQLDEARMSYSNAQSDPEVAKRAAGELQEAGDALAKANQANDKGQDKEVVDHLAYLAKQRVAIAEQVAKRRSAEETIQNADAERARVRLEMRTAEAEAARQRAEAAEAAAAQTAAQLEEQAAAAAAAREEAALAQQSQTQTSAQLQEAQAKLAQMQSELQDLNAKNTNRGVVITLSDVLFDTGKAQLKPGAQRSLQKLAEFLQEYPERNAMIEGFTDSTGSEEFNEKLSEDRADAVRTALVGLGVAPERIVTRGYGEQFPVASNSTAAGRQLNRRVEIVLSDEQGNVVARPNGGQQQMQPRQPTGTAEGGQAPRTPAMGGGAGGQESTTIEEGAPPQ